MKRKGLFILVAGMLLIGCGKVEEKPLKETEDKKVEVTAPVETVPQVEEEQPKTEEQKETKKPQKKEEETKKPIETDKKETPKEETSKKESTKDTEKKKEESKKKEETKKEETPKKETKKKVSKYDPKEVVKLATKKTKKHGKILLTENLDRLLKEGQITKEEYDEYYPYDGAGYYSVFVETDLNEARTTSGRKLESIDGIATYIAEMLALEKGPYFLIEYTGITKVSGTSFYEFRCYRA